MKRLIIFFVFVLIACGGPSESDIQATVQASVQRTAQAQSAQNTAVAFAVSETQAAQPTAVPKLTVKAYQALVDKETAAITEGLSGFTTLLEQKGVHDAAWRTGIGKQLEVIHEAHVHLTAIEAPEVMKAIHEALLDATGDCDKATTLIPQGLDGNTSALTQASTLMGSCADKTTTVAIKLHAFDVSQ
jgi:hypothetical protein